MDVVKQFGLKSNLVFTETLGFDFDYLVILTNQNNIKKITKSLLLTFKKFPTIVMGLGPKEQIIKVLPIKEGDRIGAISQNGLMLIYKESQVRPMGKTSGGVKAIDLADNDKVADIFRYKDEPFISAIHDDQKRKTRCC